MNSALLGKSLGGVVLNRRLSAASMNSIHAGSWGLNETDVTPKVADSRTHFFWLGEEYDPQQLTSVIREPTGQLPGPRSIGREASFSMSGLVLHRRVQRVVSLHSSRTVPGTPVRKLLPLREMPTRILERLL